jgi:hypothetical protein
MLGSGSFAFDSPNVIDPGELPPSRPQRQSSIAQQEEQQSQQRRGSQGRRGSNTDSTDENSSSSDEFLREPPNSAARLLRDIEDIDHLAQDYDPYDEEEAAASAAGSSYSQHEQLPSVEEARMYATSLLSAEKSERSKRRSPSSQQNQSPETVPLSFNRTIKLDARNSNHLVRARIIRCLVPFFVVVGLLGTTIALGLVLINRLAEKDSDGSSSVFSARPESRYKQIMEFLAKDVSSKYDLETAGSPQEVCSTDTGGDSVVLPLFVSTFPVYVLVLFS